MSKEDLSYRLGTLGAVSEDSLNQVVELLVWFGFLGVDALGSAGEEYSYDVQSNLRRLLYPLQMEGAQVVVHPAFGAALDING